MKITKIILLILILNLCLPAFACAEQPNNKLKGKILLQVEEHREAYYMDIEGNAHYLKNGSAAYTIMRELGLGITNNDLRKIEIGEIN